MKEKPNVRPTPLPDELKRTFDNEAYRLEMYLQKGDFRRAEETATHLYNLMLRSQPDDGWYHKGYALHNIGVSLLFQNRAQDAFQYFILAFIEDGLAEHSGEDVRAKAKPAANVLRTIYEVPESMLDDLFGALQRKVSDRPAIKDPQEVLTSLPPVNPPKRVTVELKKQPGRYSEPWQKRIFIGGSYDMVATINEIRKIVVDLGFEPVIPLEFDIPAELAHHHSLMLLHDCKYAIFDVSKESGQMMEIERTRDYEVETFTVHQKHSFHASAMIRALLERQGVTVGSYEAFADLRGIIEKFLKGQ